jgi:hypothetical protein
VILELSSLCLRLRACSPEGELEQPPQCVEFDYERLVQVGLDDDEMAVWFEIACDNRPTNKRIKIYTGFVSLLFLRPFIFILIYSNQHFFHFFKYLYVYDCLKKAKDELKSQQMETKNKKADEVESDS